MRFVRYTYPTARAVYANSSSAWSGLDSEINRLFQSVASGLTSAEQFPVDVYSDKENVYVRAELPGVVREALNVEVVDDQLTISAVRKTTEPAESEAKPETFSRVVTIPEQVQADKVTAQYQDGVLTVTLPKVEAVKPRKVSVSVN